MKLLQPPLDPLERYVSRSSPVSGWKKASQCNVPQPVTKVRLRPIQLSSAFTTNPLGYSLIELVSLDSFSGFSVRIPILLQLFLKIVTPFKPCFQASI